MYHVRKGDTIIGIAFKYGITPEKLLDANPQVTNPRLIYPGQKLEIPGSDVKGDFDVPSVFCSPVDSTSGQLIPDGWHISLGFNTKYPMGYGKLSGQHHSGVDIAQSGCYGESIYAIYAGTIVQAGDPSNDWGWGNIIVLALSHIGHNLGARFVRYAHMSKVSVKKGDIVGMGDILGEIGDADGAYAPHLHFDARSSPYKNVSIKSYGTEDWIDSNYIDPHSLYEGA